MRGRSSPGPAAPGARNLARAGWAVSISLVAGALALGLANRPEAPLYEVTSAIITPTFATLGALISARRPGNVIGWIFLAAGVLGGAQMLSGQYAKVVLAPDVPALPGGDLAAWFATLAQNAFVVSILFLVLLFPDGALPSRRWRPLAWAIGTFIAVSLVFVALSPGPFVDFPSASNPFGVEKAMPPGPVLAAGQLALISCVVAVLLSLVLRFYRSRGEERLQLKWFTYAAAVGLSTPMLLSVAAPAAFEVVGRLAWTLAFLGLPVSAAVAILKYRLYDIDRIINRTLVYAALTAVLVILYVGSVFSLQYVFRTLSGETSQLVIVASTLAIAALFNPLRRRIQSLIDRRFYRSKYDARKALDAFTVKLREETDLGRLSDDLISVVRDTLQPTSASLWLRTLDRRPATQSERRA